MSILKPQVKLRACHVASYRTWCKTRYEDLDRLQDSGGLAIVVHRIRSDATNASVWQRCKLNVVEVMTTFPDVQLRHDDLPQPLDNVGTTRKILGDLQVARHSTGRAQLALMEKQIQSVGVAPWALAPPSALAALADGPAGSPKPIVNM